MLRALLIATFSLCMFPLSSVIAQDGTPLPVGATRAVLDKLIKTGRIISKEKADWALGREILTSRIAVVRQEIQSLRAKLGEAAKSLAQADKKKASLAARASLLEAATGLLHSRVGSLEKSTRELLKRLPAPLVAHVKPLGQLLSATSKKTPCRLTDRFMGIVGILNAVNKFNRQITVTNEVHTLDDGSKAEVTVLYAGIGQAYYASRGGHLAGTGESSKSGWTWFPANSYNKSIARVIAIFRNEQTAAFVNLPIHIK